MRLGISISMSLNLALLYLIGGFSIFNLLDLGSKISIKAKPRDRLYSRLKGSRYPKSSLI